MASNVQICTDNKEMAMTDAATKCIRLIVGLGNPGSEYARTRHNAGFWFLDALARRENAFFREESKFKGEVCRVRLAGHDIWLLKPTTFMNASGQAVAALALYYKILPDEILVVHDELDLPPGCMKLKYGGGNAGHNGLKDISSQLGTPDFWRLRLGTGHPRTLGLAQQVYDFVLSAPCAEHEAAIRCCIDEALKVIDLFADGDMQRAVRTLAKFATPKKTTKAEENKRTNNSLESVDATASN